MVNRFLAVPTQSDDKKGDGGILVIFFVALISIFMIFCVADFINVMNKADIIKTSMNRAVKASAMQVDFDAVDSNQETLFGNGIFLIEEGKAKEAFKETLAGNLGLNSMTFEPERHSVLAEAPELLEFEVLNDYESMPNEYYSSNIRNTFKVEHPSVYAVVKFKVHGMLLSPEIKLGKLSSAQLLNLQDL